MKVTVPKYLQDLIDQKEGLHLDFKFEVSDYRKIAKSLVAFANTDGGKLLIGVKDNGKIAGVRTDEELYMIQGAVKLYCRPPVDFYFSQWQIGKKFVLEVTIPHSNRRPHYALDEKNVWKAYVRVKDKNFVANKVLIRVWQNQVNPSRKPISIKFERKEDFLLKFLSSHEYITFRKFYQLANIPPQTAEDVLVDLITLKIIDISFNEQGVPLYKLNENYDSSINLSEF